MKDIMRDGMCSVNQSDEKKLLTLINIKINPVHPVRLQSYDSLR